MNETAGAHVRLRGHHLLCLLGYRGMGYSPQYVENMTRLHRCLRQDPETRVQITLGPDDLCAKFPPDKPYHCEEGTVYERDAAVLGRLQLQVGMTYPWREIEQRLARHLIPGDVSKLCGTCPWLPYGVCEEGVSRLRAGLGLTKV
jgi:hypothetical protein